MKVHHCVQKVMVSERFSPVSWIANRGNLYTYKPCQLFWKSNFFPTFCYMLKDQHSAQVKKSVKKRLNPQLYHTLNESGGCICCDCRSRPSQNGRKTRHGSLGRGTLIIHDCPGSMMGNKLSVISHQRTQRHKTSNALWPYTRVLVRLTSRLQRPVWHDRIYTEKRTLINGWGNVPSQKCRGHHYLEAKRHCSR